MEDKFGERGRAGVLQRFHLTRESLQENCNFEIEVEKWAGEVGQLSWSSACHTGVVPESQSQSM